jgi:hypothetical protein
MRSILPTVVLLAVAVAYVPSEAAQRPGGMRGQGPRYDTSTEVTVHGSIQEVKQVTGGMGIRNMTGTHVILKTDQETIEIHLGPSTFIADQKLVLQKDDVVEVIGSRVTVAGANAILARQVRKGEQAVTLRDAQGFPSWSRGPRGRR